MPNARRAAILRRLLPLILENPEAAPAPPPPVAPPKVLAGEGGLLDGVLLLLGAGAVVAGVEDAVLTTGLGAAGAVVDFVLRLLSRKRVDVWNAKKVAVSRWFYLAIEWTEMSD